MRRVYVFRYLVVCNVSPNRRDIETFINPVVDILQHLNLRLLFNYGIWHDGAEVNPAVLDFRLVLVSGFGATARFLPSGV